MHKKNRFVLVNSLLVCLLIFFSSHSSFLISLQTMESENVFLMVGILCGLAIYNSIIVDLSFPLAMFRKLLGETPGLDDLKELDPIVGRSLQQLLDYDNADLADVFCLNFTVSYWCPQKPISLAFIFSCFFNIQNWISSSLC